jgi:dienelactone hydrolase
MHDKGGLIMNRVLITSILLLWSVGSGVPVYATGMVSQDVEYEVAGKMYQGYMVCNTALGKDQPAVMIIHDWDGLGEYEKKRALMLAGEGYAVFAADLYGQGIRPAALEDKKARSGALYSDRDEMQARILGGLETMRSMEWVDPKNIVVMGYCFGGSATLELARAGADVRGFVSVHGGLDTPKGQDYSRVQAPILILHGSRDDVAPMNDVGKLAAAMDHDNVDFRMDIVGGARHAFSVWSGDRYSAQADLASWSALKAFLSQHLR